MRENASSADNQQGSRRRGDPSETICRILQINDELACLLGILFTDGCVSPKETYSWRIYLVNKSKRLIDLFQECIVKVFSLDRNRVRITKRKDGFFQAIVDSKEIGNILITNFGTFRTLRLSNGKLPLVKIPVKKLLESGYTTEFLKVAFSCDGGLSFYPTYRKGSRGGTKWLIRTVFLSCAHSELRMNYISLLSSLGINTRNVQQDGKIKIETEKNIKKFYELIGFVEGVKTTNHSKFWRDYDKQEVLRLMVQSYKNPSLIYNSSKFEVKI